ncbi:MAG TPA: serine/threonine-protein kinase [Polyangiaceae bacterium]|nr:serine/threonine-protein kinase [Polyangiaceae bacterium]
MIPPAQRLFPRLVETVGEESEAKSSSDARHAQPEPSPYLAGEVVADRYRLVRELGRGGMGVVWVAHSLVLGVDVALKLIRASATNSALASRMAREANAAARLGHPALVRVFDFGWTRHGDPYLVMELVLGETLAALLKRESRIPAIRAVQTLLPIADGLRLAHDKGIVHRDIKPDNVFLAADALGRRQPKLLDFGIAKVDKQIDGRLTQLGAVLGSPDYMSPEQALGLDDLDERTDVWSLCVVLYETITGVVPFQKANYNALMHAIINEDPVSMLECGAGDKSLWQIIERGLQKQRDHRFASVSELGEALALWLYEHGIKEDLSGNSIRAVWLDSTMSSAQFLSARPAANAGDMASATISKMPTMRAPDAARAETLLTVAHRTAAPPRRSRSVSFGLPLMALLCGVAGAWAAVSVFRPKLQPTRSAAAELAPAAPAQVVPAREQPTVPPAAAPAPAPEAATASASSAPMASAAASAPPPSKPASPAAGKAKLRPAVKKRHDFGF